MPCCNDHFIPVVLIMTSNCAEEQYDKTGYNALLEQYKKTLGTYVGPTEILTCGNTVQVDDYSKYNWTLFDPEAKIKYHDETFGDYLNRAYKLGKLF